MALKVEVYQKEKVRPSSPTPQTLRYHKLSLLDVLAGPFYTPLILFYDSAAGSRRHDYDELRESLSKTLSVLYPFVGRLKDGSTIECNDEGEDLVRANVVNYDLGEFLRRHPKLEDLRRLLPRDPYPDAIDPAMPIVGVEVWIGLENEVMCNLDKDMEFQSYVSFAYVLYESSCRISSAL